MSATTAPEEKKIQRLKAEATRHFEAIIKASNLTSTNSLKIGYHAYRLKVENLFGVLGFDSESDAMEAAGVGASTWYANIRLAEAFRDVSEERFCAMKQANAKALADLPESKRNDTAWLRMAEVDSIKVFAEKVDKALNGKARASDGKESSVKLTLGMPASRKKAVEGGLNRIAKDMGIEDPGKALEVIVAEHNGSAGLIAAITKAVQKVKAAKRIIHGDLSADEQIAQVEKLMDEMVLDFKAALDQATHGDSAD